MYTTGPNIKFECDEKGLHVYDTTVGEKQFHKISAAILPTGIWGECGAVECWIPDSKVHGANMGPTWVLSDPDGSCRTQMGPKLAPWTLLSGIGRWRGEEEEEEQEEEHHTTGYAVSRLAGSLHQ